MEQAPQQQQERAQRMILLNNMTGLESKLESRLADYKKNLEEVLKNSGTEESQLDKTDTERKIAKARYIVTIMDTLVSNIDPHVEGVSYTAVLNDAKNSSTHFNVQFHEDIFKQCFDEVEEEVAGIISELVISNAKNA